MIPFHWSDHMVVWGERLENGARRRHSGGKRSRLGAPLEFRYSLLQRRTIGVPRARVIEAARETAILGALESGRKLNWLRHRSCRGIYRAPGMDRDGLRMQLPLGFTHFPQTRAG